MLVGEVAGDVEDQEEHQAACQGLASRHQQRHSTCYKLNENETKEVTTMALEKIFEDIKTSVLPAETETDIVDLILEDHRPLKEFIEVMKNLDESLEKRREAAENFAIQLVAHAKPEELTLYKDLKHHASLKADAFEGQTEHSLADQLLEEIKRTTDEDCWSARVKVLAELVEHHIQEEEDDILPKVSETLTTNERERLGAAFLDEKVKIFAMGGEDAPSEKAILH